MPRIYKALAVIVLFIIVGCSNSMDKTQKESNKPKIENSSFTGTIKEMNDDSAIVSAKILENNLEGDVFVDLSVHSNETFQVGDKVEIKYDGTIRESNPAQINTLFVELTD